MDLLIAENISKSYTEADKKLQVLDNISFRLKAGETVAITGESGSGKSTLLHVLGLLDTCDGGKILYEGQNAASTEKELSVFRNKTLGFVFQFHYLLEDFTALQNVALPNFIETKKWQSSLRKAEELLELVGLTARKQHYPNQLSGGEQQRIAIARALVNSPKILFADEPTGNLDEKLSLQIAELFLTLNKKFGLTVLIVTHNLQIASLMQSHHKLENGKLLKLR